MALTMPMKTWEKGGSGNASTTSSNGNAFKFSKDSPFYDASVRLTEQKIASEAKKAEEDKRNKYEDDKAKAKYYTDNIGSFVKTYNDISDYSNGFFDNWKSQHDSKHTHSLYTSLQDNFTKLRDSVTDNSYLKDVLSEDEYIRLEREVNAIGKSISDAVESIKQTSDVYAQYKDADSYNKHLRLSGMSSDELQEQIDALDNKSDYMSKLDSSYETSYASSGDLMLPVPTKVKTKEYDDFLKKTEAERVELTSYKNNAKYREDVEKYGVDPASMTYDEITAYLGNTGLARRKPDQYDFVNNYYKSKSDAYWYDKQAEEFVKGLDVNDLYLYKKAVATEYGASTDPEAKQDYTRFNELEKIKGKIAEKTGVAPEQVSENIALANRYFNAENREKSREAISEAVGNRPILSNVASVGLSTIGSPLAFLDQVAQTVAGKITGNDTPMDLNTAGQTLVNISNDIREETRNEIEKKTSAKLPNGSNLGVFAYDTLMTIADVATGMAIGGVASVGKGLSAKEMAKSVAKVSGFISSSRAAAGEVQEAISNGDSNAVAVAKGAIVGAIEYIAERIPIESLVAGIVNGDTAIKTVLKGALSEGTEEVVSNILAEDVMEAAFGNGVRVSRSYNDYLAQGYKKERALEKAILDVVGEDAETFVSAAISGAAFGGITAVTTRANDKANANMTQDAVANEVGGIGEINFLRGINRIMEAAEESHNDAGVAQAAQKINDRITFLESVKKKLADNGSLKRVVGENGVQAEIAKVDAVEKELKGTLDIIRDGSYDATKQDYIITERENALKADAESTAMSEGRLRAAAQRYVASVGSIKKAVSDLVKTKNNIDTATATLQQEKKTLQEAIRTGKADATAKQRIREINDSIKKNTRDADRAQKLTDVLTGNQTEFLNNALGADQKRISKALSDASGRNVSVQYDSTMGDNEMAAMRSRGGASTLVLNPERIIRAQAELEEMGESGVNVARGKVVHEAGHLAARTDGTFVPKVYEVYASLRDSKVIPTYAVNEADIKAGYRDSAAAFLKTKSAQAEMRDLVTNKGMSEEDASRLLEDRYMQEEYVMHFLEYLENNGANLYNTIVPEKRNAFVEAMRKIAQFFRDVAAKIRGKDPASAKKMDTLADKLYNAVRDFAGGSTTAQESVNAKTTENTGNTKSEATGGSTGTRGGVTLPTAKEIFESLDKNGEFNGYKVTDKHYSTVDDSASFVLVKPNGEKVEGRASWNPAGNGNVVAKEAARMILKDLEDNADKTGTQEADERKSLVIGDETAVAEDGDTRYSIKSMRHDIAEGKMFDDLVRVGVFSREDADTLRDNLDRLVKYMIPFAGTVDMNEEYGQGDRPFRAYKPNSDPLYVISLDFSTLCRKRLMTQYVIEQLQLRENRPMTAEEQIAIRSMLLDYRKQNKALQVACAMCYVEAARLKAPKQMEKFFTDTESILKTYFAKKDSEFNAKVRRAQEEFKVSRGYEADTPKSGMKGKDVTALNRMSSEIRRGYEPSEEQAAIIETAKSLPRSTFLTAANLTELSVNHPEIYDAYTSHIRASTRSKSLEGDIPYYYGDSEGIVSDSFIENVNEENGFRFDSWSDFQMKHMLDMITAVIELSVRGSKMHGYTKFPEMVRIFGKTGMMFNLSGVAAGNGFDADGNLAFSDVEGMAYEDAVKLRKDFPETAGFQCIGVSHDHIRALLRSDDIDYVIPYHTSGLNATLRRMVDIYGWKDYTGVQNAKKDPNAKKPANAENWQTEPVWSEFYVSDGKDGYDSMQKTAQRYIDMCHERGLIPKFNDFTDEPNYWKLLIDRKMVNQKTGALIEQKPVRPDFDFGLIEDEVKREVSEYDPKLEQDALNYVVDNFDAIGNRIRELKKIAPKKKLQTVGNEVLQAYAEGSKVVEEELSLKQQLKTIDDVVDKAIKNMGNIGEKYNQKPISDVNAKTAAMVLQASNGKTDISSKRIALSGYEIWHEYQRHSDVAAETDRGQVALTQRRFANALKAIYKPDVVECLFPDGNNPTQRASFAYAKRTKEGNYVVVEAVGGKTNPNIVPVEVIHITKKKWDQWIGQGKTLGEMLYKDDAKKLNALNVAENKKNRVTAAQFASNEAIANTLRSPRFEDSIAQNPGIVKTSDEDSRNSLVLDSAYSKTTDSKPFDPLELEDEDMSNREAAYEMALELGDLDMAEEIVMDAARANGYNSPKLYHGTQKFGFTKPNPRYSDDGISFFATSDLDVAHTYSSTDGVRYVSDERKPRESLFELENYKTVDELIKRYESTDGTDKIKETVYNEMLSIIERANNEMGFEGYWDTDGAQYIADRVAWYLTEGVIPDKLGAIMAVQDYLAEINEELDESYAENGGNYQFYGNTDGFLEIDAGGSVWSRIDYTPPEVQDLWKKWETLTKEERSWNAKIQQYATEHGVSRSEAQDKVRGYWEFYDAVADLEERIEEAKRQSGIPDEASTREIASWAKRQGYKGVIIKNLFDDGGRGKRGQEKPADVYIFFDPASQVRSADVVTYDDNGKVIPLSERFNPLRDDIRYSKETTDKRIARLKEDKEFLKQQMEKSRSVALSPADVDKIVKDMRDQFGFDNSERDNIKKMLKLIDDVVNKKIKPERMDEVWDSIARGARSILEGVYEVDASLMKENEKFAERVASTPISVPADSKREFEGRYTDYKKENRKYVNLSTDGTPVESVYPMLCAEFPGILDGTITDPVDMVEEIVSVMKSIDVPVYADTIDQASQEFVNVLGAKYMNTAQKTYAQQMRDKADEIRKDKFDRRVEAEVKRVQSAADRTEKAYKREIERIGKANDKRLQQTVTAYEARLNRIENAAARDAMEYERIINRYKNIEEAREFAGDRKEYARRIRQDARALRSAAVSPNQKKFVPEGYRKNVENIALWLDRVSVGGVNLNSDDAKWTAIAYIRDDINKVSAMFSEDFLGLANGLLNQIEDITGEAGRAYNKDLKAAIFYRDAYKLGRLMRKSIADMNKVVIGGKNVNASIIGGEITDTLDSRERAQKTFESLADKKKGGKLMNIVFNKNLSFTDARSFFHRMGKAGDNIYETLREAQSRQYLYMKQYTDKVNEALSEEDLSRYAGEKQKVVSITLSNGKEYTLTAAQAMNIVTLYERSAGKSHIEKGGVRIYDPKTRQVSKATALTEKDIASLRNALDDTDKKVMRVLADFMRDECTAWGNEATMEKYGFHRFTTRDYFPISVDRTSIGADMKTYAPAQFNVENVGFAKTSKDDGSAPVLIDSMIDVANNHIRGMATYAAYLNVEDGINRILKVPGVVDAMKRALGSDAEKYITEMMNDLKGAGKTESLADNTVSYLNKLAGRYKAAAVSYNTSTVAKQPLSYLRAAAVLDAKYLVKGASGNHKVAYDEMMKHSGIAVRKEIGYSDVGVGKTIGEQIGYTERGTLKSGVRKFNEFGMAGAALADRVTWESIWLACKAEQAEKNAGAAVDRDALMKATAKRFADVVAQTQVVDSALDSAPVSRSNNPLVRFTYAFMSEPIKGYNLLVNALDDLVNSPDKNAKSRAAKHLARVSAYTILGWAAEAAITSAFSAIRDDDDEILDKFSETYFGNLGQNALGILPMADPIVDAFFEVFKGYTPSNMADQTIVDVASTMVDAYKTFIDPEGKRETKKKAARDAAESVFTMIGVPVKNIVRMVNNTAKSAFQITNAYKASYELQKIWYNPNNATAREKNGFNSILADAYLSGDREAFEYIYEDMRKMGLKPQQLVNSIAKDSYEDDIADKDKSTLVKYTPGSDAWYIGMKTIFNRDEKAPKATEDEITRVYKASGETSVLPKFKDGKYTVDGTSKEFEGDALDKYLEDYGNLYYEVANAMRDLAAYRKGSAEEQAWWLTKAEKFASAAAIYAQDKEYSVTSVGKWVSDYIGKKPYEVAKYIVGNLEKK